MTDTLADSGVDDAVLIATLWGGVRIVVIDIETTSVRGGGSHRAVSIAGVVCRQGRVLNKWEMFVNPGVPVSRETRAIHGITDEQLADQPMFADVTAAVLDLFTEHDGERLVVAGHNVGFDVSVLRHELGLLGMDLPELPVLDTMGKLVGAAGVKPPSGSLADLLTVLDIVNPRPHDALADAVATAEAVVKLLNRAAAFGHTNFDELLAEVSGDSTTHTVKAGGRARITNREPHPALPPEHVTGHATLLSKRAGIRMLAAWQDQVAECATLRCRHLDDRVAQGGAAPLKRLAAVEAVVAERAEAGDVAGTATALAAMLPLLDHLTPRKGRLGFRTTALNWAKQWAPALSPLGRCGDDDRCPACRDNRPCALDQWPEVVGRLALGDPDRYADGFFETTGREAGTGAYTTWRAKGTDARVADAAVWLCVEHWQSIEQDVKASRLAQLAWDAGCRHPDVAVAYAGDLAAPGRIADITAALDVIDEAVSTQGGSTIDGWVRARSRRDLLAGQAQRLVVRYTGEFDADGNPIPRRRHHPEQPERPPRTPRFQRW